MTCPEPGGERLNLRLPEDPWDDYEVMFIWWRNGTEELQTMMSIACMRWHQRMQPESDYHGTES